MPTRTFFAASLLPTLLAVPAATAADLKVVNPEGRPVAEARVEVFIEGGPTSAFAAAERPLDAAVTDGDGVASVRIPAVEGVAMIVDLPGFVPRLLEGAAAHESAEVWLDLGEPLEGKVEPTEAGEISEGGTVCAHGRLELRMGGRSREWRRCAPVAADGAFLLSGLPDSPVELEVRVPGHLPLRRTVESREPIRLTAQPGVPIAGRVADLQGRPIDGAEIESQGTVPTKTEADGRFVVAVPGLPAELRVRAPGFRDRAHRVKETSELDIRLEPAEQIAVTLLGELGDEINEVEVWFQDVTPGSQLGGRKTLATNEQDQIRFDLLGPGRYSLRFLARGYRERVHPPIEVGPGRFVSLGVIQLSRGAGVQGVLLDAGKGTPLHGVVIEALPVGGSGLGLLAEGRGGEGEVSDAAGVFTLAGLDVGRYHLRWRREGYATVHQLIDLASDGLLDLGTMYLDGGVSLHGRLTDRAGEPRPGSELRLFDPANEVLLPLAEAIVEADGAYRFEPIAPGRYRIQVASQPLALAQEATARRLLLAQEFEIAPGSPEQRLDLHVGGVTIHGQLSHQGLPVAGGRVSLVPALELRPRVAPTTVRTGDKRLSFARPVGAALGEVGGDGSFTLYDIPPGLAWLAYADTSGARRVLRLLKISDRAESTVEVEIEGYSLSGTVADEETGLTVQADVSLQTVTGLPFERLHTGPDGGFHFDNLETGRYELKTRADGYVPKRHEIELADASERLRIELEPSRDSGRLEVILRHADGTPASATPAVAINAGGDHSLIGRPQGDRVVANLPAGEYRVGWTDPLYGAGVSDPVRVGPGRRPLVDQILTPGASVVVACPAHRCADTPVELVAIHTPEGTDLTPQLSGIMPAVRFSTAGDLSLGRLSPGKYVFSLWIDGELRERKVTVGAGKVRVWFP